jgi:hypothetical protein
MLPQRITTLVNARFEATRCPGLSVAVASQNQIVFSKAMGTADVEQNVPLTTASIQRLASLPKPITGTIIICSSARCQNSSPDLERTRKRRNRFIFLVLREQEI